MRRPALVRNSVLALCSAGLIVVAVVSAQKNEPSPCTVAQGPSSLQGVAEASGLTLSRRTTGLLWTHNDSGPPVLFALDATGVRSRVRVSNATVDDWEDVSAADCASADCLYIADIGDNNRSRTTITVYRVPEPKPDETDTASPEVITLAYPDGAHDAEAMFVTDSGLFIITKDEIGTVYRAPLPRPSGGQLTLQRIGSLGLSKVTDADISRDGMLVAVRTNDEVVFYPAGDFARGISSPPRGTRVSLKALNEPQGEGVAVGPGGTVYLVSEGSGAGRLTTLRCTL